VAKLGTFFPNFTQETQKNVGKRLLQVPDAKSNGTNGCCSLDVEDLVIRAMVMERNMGVK
jgi:hypothetical protein